MPSTRCATPKQRPKKCLGLVVFSLAIALAAPTFAKPTRKPAPPVAGLPSAKLKVVTKRILQLTIERRDGRLRIKSMLVAALKKKRALRRYRGHFVVRLWAGKRLLETVPFSFPLALAAGEPTPANRDLNRRLARGVASTVRVVIPYPDALSSIEVADTIHKVGFKKSLKGLLGGKARPDLGGPKRTDVFGKRR